MNDLTDPTHDPQGIGNAGILKVVDEYCEEQVTEDDIWNIKKGEK